MRKVTVVYLVFLLIFGVAGKAFADDLDLFGNNDIKTSRQDKAKNPFAERPDIRLSAGIGYLQGETSYQIGGHFDSPQYGPYDYRFPISELDWPLNVVMGSVDFTASYWRLSGALSYKTNLSDPKQKMEDSDWGAISGDPEDLMDVYSESSVTLDAKIFDGNINFEFLKYKDWGMQIGVGYLWQDFSYVGSNVDQWYPPYPSEPHFYYGGRVIAYDVTYEIPYAQLLVNFNTKKFRGALVYQYSPFVNAEDEDKHLLRSKVGKGYDSGYMNAVRFNCTYDFTKHFFGGLDLSWRQIQTTGYQRQHQEACAENKYQEWWGDIDNEIYSEQRECKLSAGFKF
jgi:outer membrane protease